MTLQILSIIIGLFGAIGGILWIKTKYANTITYRRFNRIFQLYNKELLIVTPTQEKSDVLPFIPTTYEDSISQSISQVVCSKYGIKANTINHTNISENDLNNNLLLICGPVGNSITKKLLSHSEIQIPYRFNEINGEWMITDFKKSPLHPNPILNKNDYSILLKIHNPWTKSTKERKYIYLAAGIWGIGTWGSTSFLFNNINELYNRLKLENINPLTDNFCVLLKTEKSNIDYIRSRIMEVEKV